MYFNYLTFYRRLAPREFNSYGSRRGNDAVMARGTFANIRLVNKFIGKAAPKTLHLPSGDTVRWKLYLDSCNLFPKVRLFFPLWPACWNSRAAFNQPYVFSLWRRLTYVYVVWLSLLASIVIGLWRDRVKPTTRSAYLHLLCTCFVVVVLSVLIWFTRLIYDCSSTDGHLWCSWTLPARGTPTHYLGRQGLWVRIVTWLGC